MATRNDKGAPAPTQTTNPFLTDHTPYGYALVVQLLPRLSGGPDIANNAHDSRLLSAVSGNCASAVMCIHTLVQSIGRCQAIASNTGVLPEESVTGIGWGLEFLAALAEGFVFIQAHADYHLKEREVGDE